MSNKLRDYEIYYLFDKMEGQPILERILTLKENEAKYKNSDFYKIAKIPFMELYKNYLELKKLSKTSSEKFDEFFEGLDEQVVVKKIIKVIESLEKEDKIQLFIEKLISSFDISKLNVNKEELSKLIKNMKNM